jgi:signal peptidase II
VPIELPVLAGLAVVILDRSSKAIIAHRVARGESLRLVGGLRLRHVSNGRALLVRVRSRMALAAWGGLVAAVLVLMAAVPVQETMLRVGLGTAVGGATGNLLDAVRRGAIVDFIDVGFWPVFNLADLAIVVGITIALLGVH